MTERIAELLTRLHHKEMENRELKEESIVKDEIIRKQTIMITELKDKIMELENALSK